MPDATETPLERPVSAGSVEDAPTYPPVLAAALVAALGELSDVPANRTAKVQTRTGRDYEYRYADLSDVHTVTRPVLARHGLAIVQHVEVDGRVTVTTELVHVSGLSVRFPPIVFPGGDAQAVGSATTYARRYGLCAALGITPAGSDDDGRSAAVPPALPEKRRELELGEHEPVRHANGPEQRLQAVRAELAEWERRLAALEDHPVAVTAKAEFLRAGLGADGRRRLTVANGNAVLAALNRLEPKVIEAERDMLLDDEPPPEDDG